MQKSTAAAEHRKINSNTMTMRTVSTMQTTTINTSQSSINIVILVARTLPQTTRKYRRPMNHHHLIAFEIRYNCFVLFEESPV